VSIYQRIWTPEGSPYLLHSEALERSLARSFAEKGDARVLVRMAHRYGSPSMADGLCEFQQQGIGRVVVLPLYPQQAFPTTHSVHDELMRLLPRLSYSPDVSFVWDYFDDPAWLHALADSIRPHLPQGPSKAHLLLSFHSVPLKDVRRGDPYPRQVEECARAVAGILGLPEGSFSVAYQSQFDDTQRWLGPFLHERIEELKAQGVEDLRIVCPGFSVDCTETLYDIERRLRFDLEGDFPDGHFDYIPCLNESAAHADALRGIIEARL
jgi:ferrochelatase